MPANTLRLHRVLPAAPDRVYRAFLDPDAMVKWLPPHGFTGKVHHMDARVGGEHRMAFTNFSTGTSHSFGGRYLELTQEGIPGAARATRRGGHPRRRMTPAQIFSSILAAFPDSSRR
ncbi:MAG: hypothetical protein CMLOHMNK_01788 [Steroidobacteraceae bacterium]|nr:hypothetical protein [Steroidobacteraceae bacterium]